VSLDLGHTLLAQPAIDEVQQIVADVVAHHASSPFVICRAARMHRLSRARTEPSASPSSRASTGMSRLP
jgi:hypothetical protein